MHPCFHVLKFQAVFAENPLHPELCQVSTDLCFRLSGQLHQYPDLGFLNVRAEESSNSGSLIGLLLILESPVCIRSLPALCVNKTSG